MNDTADTGADVVVIFGGRSEIGLQLALRLAPGATVVLAVRGGDGLDRPAGDLRAVGAMQRGRGLNQTPSPRPRGVVTNPLADPSLGSGPKT